MLVESLRAKHPAFIYEGLDINGEGNKLEVDFRFTLEPDITFHPKISIPIIEGVRKEDIENFAFHLGLVESISYWKAACSPRLIIKAGQLNEQQVIWWHDLFIHGLGEFFYRNEIDFTKPDFLSIVADSQAITHKKMSLSKPLSGDLVMVGGGKDSAVTLDVLRKFPKRRNVLILNPTRAALRIAETAGYNDALVVKRTLDGKLLDLNRKGYLNGHTPFSAYLAFLGVFVSVLHDYETIVASNEQSAGEGNVVFHGLEVNHQYSKSFRFEKLFREYCAKYLNGDIQYFSFLRPLYELQIARLFVEQPGWPEFFCSCNNNRGESWCGTCAKCAFVYLSLCPFLSDAKMKEIFGRDFFAEPQIQKHILGLVGLEGYKPFDCVGTTEESIMAVALVIKKYEIDGQATPDFFVMLKTKLELTGEYSEKVIKERLKTDWNNNHFLPPEYAKLLKKRLSQL